MRARTHTHEDVGICICNGHSRGPVGAPALARAITATTGAAAAAADAADADAKAAAAAAAQAQALQESAGVFMRRRMAHVNIGQPIESKRRNSEPDAASRDRNQGIQPYSAAPIDAEDEPKAQLQTQA